ncbi:hypothetical protein AAFF_G00386000 [Aldrovandia affinis]|uniref:Uncharacterized protein n=1 Tax=Aldrovandia affinis TaxID=143900 RepID=A0AAD7WME2_9TELE|nr:hypothetical protein AAFF_G00386000 [Aldrovandia affinis]
MSAAQYIRVTSLESPGFPIRVGGSTQTDPGGGRRHPCPPVPYRSEITCGRLSISVRLHRNLPRHMPAPRGTPGNRGANSRPISRRGGAHVLARHTATVAELTRRRSPRATAEGKQTVSQ